ncbi:MAG TPA: UDP-N-acetylmuramoyl-L-alanine--D-glutamate ligase [Prosthecochloris aestuarii]|uniref:UDP-N-acetylmuramoylalanine--D-glutamate ligase n=1 Tax=Prosthecochloris aestuarii TaxID=1102 RepID=A0A831WPJ5_PROAE|nr:UDP-N-acetylmuramoyl-L-alanine--D-glutamate ligase [Prosthecochloris aestuarii]
MKRDLLNTRTSVIGARRSGVAAALLLREQGAEVFVSEYGDMKACDRAVLDAHGVEWEDGGHSPRVFDASLCVVSPGVPPDSPVMEGIRSRGIEVVSEIEVASWFCRATVIAVTGTDGKTTTASLVSAICREYAREKSFQVFTAGNIGVPFSSVVAQMSSADIAVVEISSYQLETCSTFSPRVSVITNIAPDHLDRYGGSMDAYARAKYRIFASQGEDDVLVVNYDDPLLREKFGSYAGPGPRLAVFGTDCEGVRNFASSGAVISDGRLLLFDAGAEETEVIREEELLKQGFTGRHNVSNALAATMACRAVGVPVECIRRALAGFRGVEHRQEYVCIRNGVICINDSKATNLNALQKALEALDGPLVLIAGGRDKGSDYRVLRELIASKVSFLAAFGEARARFRDAYGDIVHVEEADSLGSAVSLALCAARPGQVLLFSPGCSSFDMFEDFEHRGRVFKQIITEGEHGVS